MSQAGNEARFAAAMNLARDGIPVFPITPLGKSPLTPHGLKDASIDPEVIRRWWRRWPAANLGVPTGAPGVDVLDIDVRPDGDGRVAAGKLWAEGLIPPGAPTVITPSGGMHIYFKGSQQRNGSLHNEHVDFRSAGGYVLVPPSVTRTETYQGNYRQMVPGVPTVELDWAAARELMHPAPPMPATPAPARVPHRAGGRRWGVETLARRVSVAVQGNRNNLLFWAFSEAYRCGYDQIVPPGLQPLEDAGLACGQTPKEVQDTERSAFRRVCADGQYLSKADRATTTQVTGRGATRTTPGR